MERLLQHAWHQRRFLHGDRHLGHRLGDRFDVYRLKIFFVQTRTRRLAGNAQDRDRVGGGGVKAGDHVGARRAGSADAHADVAGGGAGVTFSHVRGPFHVPRQIVFDAAVPPHRIVEGVDRRAGHAERGGDPFFFQHVHCRVYRSHNCHVMLSLIYWKIFPT